MKDSPTIERPVSQRKQINTNFLGNAAKTNRCIRVVVAEDSVDMRKLMGFIFDSFSGYTVRFGENGEDAWTKLCDEPFDLLITEIEMSRLNGIELVGRMRQHSFQQPVIFISESFPADAPGLFESLSPCDGLEKPFSFAELLTKARTMTHCKTPDKRNGSSRSA